MKGRGDKFIKLGFWSQLILLFLVDWGSIAAFAKLDVPWYHYVGFAVINVVLLWSTWLMWGWLKPQKTPTSGFPGGFEE
jgi:cytochrome b